MTSVPSWQRVAWRQAQKHSDLPFWRPLFPVVAGMCTAGMSALSDPRVRREGGRERGREEEERGQGEGEGGPEQCACVHVLHVHIFMIVYI